MGAIVIDLATICVMPRGPHKTSQPTLSEVAAAAGVGRATAARALGDYGYVSEEMRGKVLEAADRIGYRPNALAKSMATGVTRTVGVVVADVANPFFAGVIRGVSDELRPAGIDCLVASTDEDVDREAEIVEALLRKQVDGIIVASAAGVDEEVPHLVSAREQKVPIVLVDRSLHRFAAPTVVLDNVGAARAATELLLDQGHKRIALVWGPSPRSDATQLCGDELSTAVERFRGYKDALESRGFEVDPKLVAPRPLKLGDAARSSADVFDVDDPPTGIVAIESAAALVVLKGLREHGLRCPGDVSLAAFDDAPWTELVDPPLSVIQQPLTHMGQASARQLRAIIASRDLTAVDLQVLPASIVSRESVARI